MSGSDEAAGASPEATRGSVEAERGGVESVDDTALVASATAQAPSPTTEARAKALASPLRWRILRLCLHEARTNRDLASILGRDPASVLHHVRTLVDTGYLAAQEPRRGRRGAREIPYLATRMTWDDADTPAGSDVLVRTFLDEIDGLPQEDVGVVRVGMLLSKDELGEVWEAIDALSRRIAERRDASDGVERTPWSMFLAVHPDRQGPLDG